MTGAESILTLADLTVYKLEVWMLVLLRVGFAAFLLPVFSSDETPARLKAGLSFFLSIIIFPIIPESTIVIPSTVPGYFMLALRELYVGAVMGFASTFVFTGIRIAGAWIDQETGFAVVQLFNPLASDQESAMSQMLFLLFAILFLSVGGYEFYVRAIAESFHVIPLTNAAMESEGVLHIFARLSGAAFIFGLKASAPILVTLFVSSLGLAIIARIMPQMNVWLVGMPLKIGLGILTLSFTLPLIWQVFLKDQDSIQRQYLTLLELLGPR